MTPSACRECNAALAATDRFCPACGTPNVGGKLHPRLPPSLREREAYVDRAPAPGQAACLRCGRGVERGDPFCRSCGFALEDGDPWREAAAAIEARPGTDPYRELGSLSLWVRVTFRTLIVLTVLAAVASAALSLTLGELRARSTADVIDRRDLLDTTSTTATAALAGLGLLCALLSALWLRRALANNPALGALPTRLGLGWVIPGVLVPGLNLVVPALLLDEAWKGSDPDRARLDEGRWRSGQLPLGLWIGWVLILLFAVVLLLGQTWDPSSDMLANEQFTATLDAVALGVLAVGLIVLHIASTPLGDRQELRAERLGILPTTPRGDDDDLVPSLHSGETWGRY